MRYCATASGPRVREAMRCGLLDQICTPATGNVVTPGVRRVCFDNGIYSNAYPGDTQYLRYLDEKAPRDKTIFAVAPDVVADHDATLARSWPMLRRIRGLGVPVALCAQNGAQPDDMPWDYIDAVFLAGIAECVLCGWVPAVTDLPLAACPQGHQLAEWKTSAVAEAIAVQAKARGLWVHMGRVNTRGRVLRAKAMGCDSADGTYLAYGPDQNLPRLLSWLCEPAKQSAIQPALFSLEAVR